MGVEQEIRRRLERDLQPEHLEIINQSHLHAGHYGDDGSGESHFKLMVVSSKFLSCSRIQRQRMVLASIGPDIYNKIHALSISCRENLSGA